MPNNNEGSTTPDNLNAVLQSMVEGMIIQDSSGQIIQFNQAALDILGMSESQVNEPESNELASSEAPIGLSESEWNKIFPGKNHTGMNSLKTGEIQRNLVMRIFRYDGEVRWISLNAVPIINHKTGRPHQVVSTFTDITEMRRVLNDLKQVQLLFNISQDLMIIANLEGYFNRINPRFTEVLGYTLPEVISKKFLSLVHQDDLESTSNKMKKIAENKSIHFINRYKTKSNDYRVFDWVVVKDAETNLVYFTARDITDYRAEELDLLHASRYYSIGEITSGLAYAINAQLSIMGGHLSYVKYQIGQNKINILELKKKIQSIEDAIGKMAKTIKDLGFFARSTENEEIADIPFSQIAENVHNLSKERFRIHGVKLDVAVEEDLIIRCRQSQIAQVLITLLNNSYNSIHSQRDSWVKLEAISKNGRVLISVTDSGEKKPEAHMNIPKGIIEENFGAIYFDNSSPNSKFVIEFPRVQREKSNLK